MAIRIHWLISPLDGAVRGGDLVHSETVGSMLVCLELRKQQQGTGGSASVKPNHIQLSGRPLSCKLARICYVTDSGGTIQK